MPNLLLIGRWHAVTRDQEAALRKALRPQPAGKIIFVITARDQSGTRRHPLAVGHRREIVGALGEKLGRKFEIHEVDDISDSARWVDHLRSAIPKIRDTKKTLVVAANETVLEPFEKAGYRTIPVDFRGSLPADVFGAIVSGSDWQSIANTGTVRVYRKHRLDERIKTIFADVLLTDDGELSTGRDFTVYARGMDASLAVKITDICPHITPGLIVDKGCGTGSLLVELSQLFPTSQIVGVDLSQELLRTAESKHYPNQNVAIVRGNIVKRHFTPRTVSTVIFSSVLHEVYSYNGYDREQVRLALRSTHEELRPGGRVIIRDGVRPPKRTVWMRCEPETESRFRRFAEDFKAKSPAPGIRIREKVIGGQTWFRLSLHEANEFLSKKDYLENWAIEVNEEFGIFTLPEWRREMRALGYRVKVAQTYVNPWILKKRYDGKAWLHADSAGKPGKQVPFPATTMVLVGEAV